MCPGNPPVLNEIRVDDEWRLACQMVLRDEDIIVDYPSR